MPRASIIVACNDATRLEPTLRSLCRQTFPDFEIIVVDDSPDQEGAAVAEACGDLRIRVLSQNSRGIAAARNAGIAAARGEAIGFCDAGDLWARTKLVQHLSHLQANPAIGLSYSGTDTMSPCGRLARLWQMPRRRRIEAATIFKRNPIGPASTVVMRRDALLSLAFRPPHETERDWWFDETFRQCETLEFWLRFALVTDWEIASIPRALCTCRTLDASDTVSSAKQLAAWERIVTKLSAQDRLFFGRHARAARAYHLRHIARRAILARDAGRALHLLRATFATSLRPLAEEPARTLTICANALSLSLTGNTLPERLEHTRNSST